MKKNRDFFSDDFPFFEEGSDIDKDKKEEKLPDVFCGDAKKSERGESGILTVFRFLLPFAIMITAVLLAFVILLIATGKGGGSKSDIPVFTGDSDEWRGAFDSRKIYEECVGCSVSLRVGKGEATREWSGVIISDDGWIATSENVMAEADKGRIYVTLSDGREYGVGSFFSCSEGTALKIDAEGLCCARLFSRDELQGGESVIIISRGNDVIQGSVASVGDELKFNFLYSDESEGAPAFDSEGYLVGIACADAQNGNNATVRARSSRDLAVLTGKIKNK